MVNSWGRKSCHVQGHKFNFKRVHFLEKKNPEDRTILDHPSKGLAWLDITNTE